MKLIDFGSNLHFLYFNLFTFFQGGQFICGYSITYSGQLTKQFVYFQCIFSSFHIHRRQFNYRRYSYRYYQYKGGFLVYLIVNFLIGCIQFLIQGVPYLLDIPLVAIYVWLYWSVTTVGLCYFQSYELFESPFIRFFWDVQQSISGNVWSGIQVIQCFSLQGVICLQQYVEFIYFGEYFFLLFHYIDPRQFI